MRIYIASSWKNQHGVEMLTSLLRENGHEVVSWIENNFDEGMTASGEVDFEKWVKTESAQNAFTFDIEGAGLCDLFVYYGNGGKDAAAECGICYGRRFTGNKIPMIALWAKGEDFGLMRKMFDHWVGRYDEVLKLVESYELFPNELKQG